ncbi:hypothetical protein PAL_GLEAN10002791 [Pteropus alecto]|uniref:Uncharacterized protein n=1 Tax=Pteropus alecto TaxID=9402 RepID=L5K5A1_PTEAL|nr:hypothetical protein PAL_GLEAN10002791 [Pteropus alecto]
MAVRWSGLHRVAGQSVRISWASGCPLCVSSPTFEFGLEIETANEHGWGGRAHGSAGKALLLRQGNSMGSSTGFEHKGHCSTE